MISKKVAPAALANIDTSTSSDSHLLDDHDMNEKALRSSSTPLADPSRNESAVKLIRNRPGILSRQASERDEAETNTILQSASEDDDAGKQSDTGSLPQRFPTNPSSAASSMRRKSQAPSPLSPPLASSHYQYGSGGEASASSSRSHLPLQSKTSLYRSQASAGNSHAGDWSEDGGIGLSHGSDSLNRAKSVSSVSSVNSTSSMEAVPFRAAPLGNVRVGYGGYGGSRYGPKSPQGALKVKERRQDDPNFDEVPQSAHAALQNSHSTSMEPLHLQTPGKQRLLPKGPSDEWHFRNAPGMGARGGSRTSISNFHTIASTKSMDRPSLVGAFTNQDGSGRLTEEAEYDQSNGSSSSPLTSTRIKPSIRSKLAKRAGKLGLKPLTHVVAGGGGGSSSSSTPTQALIHSNASLDTPLLRDGAKASPGPSITLSSSAFSPTAKLSPEVNLRSGKSYFSTSSNNTNSLVNLTFDGEAMTRTSSVTNAPLVVPKHPPGPPRSGPSPSPGLTGPPSPFYQLPFSSPKVSPQRLGDDIDPLEDNDSKEEAVEVSFGNSVLDGKKASANRVGSRNGLNGLLGSMYLGNDTTTRNPPPTLARSPSPGLARISTPSITPAQQIQIDAKAGLARAPAEPSGANPGPNPSIGEDYAMQGDLEEDQGDEEGGFPAPFARPHSNSISTQQTVVKLGQHSKGQPHRLSVTSSQRRPGLLRAMTSDSLVLRRSAHEEDTKGIAVDENTGVSKYWSGKPVRNGSASPKGSSASSSSAGQDGQGSDRSPPLRLDIPSGGLAPTSSLFRPSSTPRPFNPSPSSNLTVEMTISNLDMHEDAPAIKGGSPNELTKPLPAIEESYLSSDGAPSQGEDNSTLPSMAVSTTTSPQPAVSIKHTEPDVAAPGAYIPHPEVSLTSQLGFNTTKKSQESASTQRATLIDSNLSSPKPSGRPRGGSVGRTTRVESDFLFGEILGEGSYSTVMEAWDMKPLRDGSSQSSKEDRTESNAMGALVGQRMSSKQKASVEGAKVYAIKVLDKVHILKQKKQKYVSLEKEALSLLIRHPGVITLYWTFQDRDSLYFVLELAPNGELLSFIKQFGSFDMDSTRYYGAQLVDAIEGMHQAGVLHRDLKPENILLDSDMKIKIADFGSAKLLRKPLQDAGGPTSSQSSQQQVGRQRSSSFVGTAEYVSPELLTDKQVSEASDWWAFGCLLFQMLCGRPPFKGASEYQTFQKIMNREFECPSELPIEAKELINSIMVLDPDQRFEANDIRSHSFFRGVDWSNVWKASAPKVQAGIFKRPAVPTPPTTARSSNGEEEDDDEEEDEEPKTAGFDGQATGISEDGDIDDSASRLDATSTASVGQSDGQSIVNREGYADDDDSSFSDTNSAVPRRRGFSAGASAAERMLTAGSNGSKRASNFFRMATGMPPLESKPDVKIEGNRRESGASFDATLVKSRHSTSSSGIAYRTGSGANLRNQLNVRHSSTLMMDANRNSLMNIQSGKSNSAASNGSQIHPSLAMSWAALLLPNESLLYSCPILHKIPGNLLRSSTKKRQLLLTDFPRLLCVKETNDELRVKSEVILGLPQSISNANTSHHQRQWDENDDDEEDDDDDEEGEEGEGEGEGEEQEQGPLHRSIGSTQIKRQSSSGPLLFTPTRTNNSNNVTTKAAAAAADTPELSSSGMAAKRRAIERRESFPLSMGPTTNSTLLSTSSSAAGTQSLISDSSGTTTRLQLVNSSNSIGSVIDASPNFMTSIEQKSIRTFLVATPAKSFLYEDPSGDATHWVKSIAMAAAKSGGRSDSGIFG